MADGDPTRSNEPPVAASPSAAPRPALFREQALEHHRGGREHGDVLRLPPAWTRWTYPLLLAAFVAAVAFLLVGRASVYAEGPVVVLVPGREDLTAATSGTVASVEVTPGETVAAGDVLVRLHDGPERAEVARARQELEGDLAERLRDPADAATGAEPTSRRAELELALARLAAKRITAPRDGYVSDVRVRHGQTLVEGDLVLSLVSGAARPTVVALLPGHALPQLAVGQEIEVGLVGYPQARLGARLSHVADRVVGPAEARRFVGPEIGDGLAVEGPVVIVRAELGADGLDGLDAHGQRYGLYDGMVGHAEVRLRREPLILLLVPGLRHLPGA